eukprot:366138-Chlamydomonas_euryale.AAC.6
MLRHARAHAAYLLLEHAEALLFLQQLLLLLKQDELVLGQFCPNLQCMPCAYVSRSTQSAERSGDCKRTDAPGAASGNVDALTCWAQQLAGCRQLASTCCAAVCGSTHSHTPEHRP